MDKTEERREKGRQKGGEEEKEEERSGRGRSEDKRGRTVYTPITYYRAILQKY